MKNKNNRLGFTLLEIVVSLGIMVLIVVAISQLYATYLRLTSDEKLKITAASLANQKIELIRNLPYSQIGTIGGIPAGTIPQTEIINRNNTNFTVSTEIIYIDDPFDGTLTPGEVENPYNINNPEVTFYWNADSVSNDQTPQKGAGTINTASTLTSTSGVANQALLYLPKNEADYSRLQVTNNINTAKGRIGFWYTPNDKNESSDRYLINISGCNGIFTLVRENSNKLRFDYGVSPSAQYISTHPLEWNVGQWYFIEVAYDDDNNIIAVYRDNQEIGYKATGNIAAPTNCNYVYIGNASAYATQNANGAIDDFWILDNPFPYTLPEDLLNTDYKRVKITVSWQTPYGPQKIYLLTDVAPSGIETTENGGTIIINVFDSYGLPLPQANVHIVNDTLIPQIDLNLTTNDNGRLILPGAPVSDKYQVIVSKNGYSTDQTYTQTIDYPTPTRPPISVIENKTTEVSFSIDLLSTITIKTVSRTLPGNWQINTGVTTTDHFYPRLVSNNDKFYFIWEDYRDDIITAKSYGQSYNFTGNKLWVNDLAYSQATNQTKPDITIDGNDNIYTVWTENSTDNSDIYMTKTNGLGTNLWNGSRKVNADIYNAFKTSPVTIFASGSIAVIWQDSRTDGGDIYFNYLDANGNRQLTNDKKINTYSNPSVQSSPRITKDNNEHLLIGWLDNRSGTNQIYLIKTDSYGNASWSSEIKINSEIPEINHDNFALTTDSNNNIYIFWSDTRQGENNIYWQKVDTNGNILLNSDNLLPTQVPSAQQTFPLAATNVNDEIFIVWQDNRSGDQNIFAHKISTNGDILWPQEMQINLEQAGDQLISDITVYNGTNLAVTWTDYSSGFGNCWIGTLNYQYDETPVPYVDINLVGTKLIYQSPDVFKYNKNLTTNAQGQLILSDIEWDTYQITVTDPLYDLQLSDPALPLILSAGTSTTIKLIVQ